MNNSIGSLAALAAIALPAATALAVPDVTLPAAFSNVVVSFSDPQNVPFDIDGDGTADFSVFGNGGFSLTVQVFDTTSLRSEPLVLGSLFAPGDATTDSSLAIFAGDTSYLGFSFITGSQTHAAWVLFDATGTDAVVVGGGWQTFPGGSVEVGNPAPIPEPASFATLAGTALLAGAALRRRRPAPTDQPRA